MCKILPQSAAIRGTLEKLRMKIIYKEQCCQIGLKIACCRKLRGLTQERLAEQVGVTPAFIGHLEAPNIARALSLGTPLISPLL